MLENLSMGSIYGGLLIGTSATLLLLFNGRIAGISTIFFSVVLSAKDKANTPWRVAFLLGLLGGAYMMLPVDFAIREGYSPILLAASGLIVGIGTRLGNGCTSGHGVCGIGMISRRGIVATITFVAAAMATVAVIRFLG